MILQAQSISKSFGTHQAVDKLNLSIKKGCFYSLLGPNGAGKTTSINMLSSLILPDSGEIFIDGLNVNSNKSKVKTILGIVPQEISLYDDLTAYENLKFWGKMYRVPPGMLNIRINKLLTEFGLLDRKDDRIKTYSGGMKRRINIAAALLHQPKIVFMDEPTVGIDPQSRNNIYDAIQKMKEDGITILYTTHYMEEAERFSDKVGIIDKGKIIAEGSLDELKLQTQQHEQLIIHVSTISEQQKNELKNKFSTCKIEEEIIHLDLPNAKKELIPVLNFCSSLQLEIEQAEIHKANLESVFLSLTGKNLRD